MPVVERCADCGQPIVHAAAPVIEGRPRPRTLLGLSVVVEYLPTRATPGGEIHLCTRCGGQHEIDRANALGPAPAPTPAKASSKAKPAPAARPRKHLT